MYGVDAEEGLPLIKQIPYAVFANLSTLFGGRLRVDFPRMLLGMALVFGLWGAIYYLFHGQKNREMFLLMLLLGVVPYVRYLALSNHSYLHEFFTYRAQAATILMPCLDEERTLGGCIEETGRYIAERHLSAEILLADNGSSDSSAQIAEEKGARVTLPIPIPSL